mmetsp:Transcript_16156/g.25841  ORF Transcript_16156/g.25841 Transcript_16156/m.25841 type:complete len:232 (-) Transcript_16156:1192-1887(-)
MHRCCCSCCHHPSDHDQNSRSERKDQQRGGKGKFEPLHKAHGFSSSFGLLTGDNPCNATEDGEITAQGDTQGQEKPTVWTHWSREILKMWANKEDGWNACKYKRQHNHEKAESAHREQGICRQNQRLDKVPRDIREWGFVNSRYNDEHANDVDENLPINVVDPLCGSLKDDKDDSCCHGSPPHGEIRQERHIHKQQYHSDPNVLQVTGSSRFLLWHGSRPVAPRSIAPPPC